MAGSRLVYDFTHNASARFRYASGRVSGSSETAHSPRTRHASPRSTPVYRPPYWVKGEDSSFGFLYAAPQPCHSRAVRCGHSPAAAL